MGQACETLMISDEEETWRRISSATDRSLAVAAARTARGARHGTARHGGCRRLMAVLGARCLAGTAPRGHARAVSERHSEICAGPMSSAVYGSATQSDPPLFHNSVIDPLSNALNRCPGAALRGREGRMGAGHAPQSKVCPPPLFPQIKFW